MTERERLIEILSQPIYPKIGVDPAEVVADFLLDNGVIVPPCKVGQTVYVVNATVGKVFQNTIVMVKVRGTSDYKNTVSVEYRNLYGETFCRKFTFAQFGKQVFFTRKEAEKALAEKVTPDNSVLEKKLVDLKNCSTCIHNTFEGCDCAERKEDWQYQALVGNCPNYEQMKGVQI